MGRHPSFKGRTQLVGVKTRDWECRFESGGVS